MYSVLLLLLRAAACALLRARVSRAPLTTHHGGDDGDDDRPRSGGAPNKLLDHPVHPLPPLPRQARGALGMSGGRQSCCNQKTPKGQVGLIIVSPVGSPCTCPTPPHVRAEHGWLLGLRWLHRRPILPLGRLASPTDALSALRRRSAAAVRRSTAARFRGRSRGGYPCGPPCASRPSWRPRPRRRRERGVASIHSAQRRTATNFRKGERCSRGVQGRYTIVSSVSKQRSKSS